MISSIFKLLRLNQWTKNLFLFLPLFFGGEFLNFEKQISVFIAFISFSLIASAIYCFNDIMDIEFDKLHPKKKYRPIASGEISKSSAYIIMIILIIGSFGVQLFWGSNHNIEVMGVLLAYFIINIFYSKYFKYMSIVDVFILSLGFVLRIIAGGIAGDVIISHWIVIMTFLLALFLSFSKRLDDLIIYEKSGTVSRKNITSYNQTFLNLTITIVATITMVSYIMYTVSTEVIERFNSDKIYVTAVFVLAGILKYLQLTIVDYKSGNPSEILLKERFIQICVVGWIGTFIYIVYF